MLTGSTARFPFLNCLASAKPRGVTNSKIAVPGLCRLLYSYTMDERILSELPPWLIEADLDGASEADIVTGFCDRCVAAGTPPGRATRLSTLRGGMRQSRNLPGRAKDLRLAEIRPPTRQQVLMSSQRSRRLYREFGGVRHLPLTGLRVEQVQIAGAQKKPQLLVHLPAMIRMLLHHHQCMVIQAYL